jgi:hypothetical protein
MVIGSPGEHEGIDPDPIDVRHFNARRERYLGAWRALDAALSARLPPRVVAFGAGEAAGLLRAYAPGAWSRVSACTADVPVTFEALSFEPLDVLPADTPLLVAVRPADQPSVAARLQTRFRSVTTWDDLVTDPGMSPQPRDPSSEF